MKNLARAFAIAGTVLGTLAAAPSVHAHATYNVGGYGDISTTGGRTNGTFSNGSAALGGTLSGGTPNGLPGGTSGGNAIAQTTSAANPVWVNGTPDWMPSTVTVPSIGYLGMHGNNSTRVIETGAYSSTANTNSPLRQVYNYNNVIQNAGTGGWGTNAATQFLDQAHTTLNPNYQNYLPSDVQLAVGGNSWAGGISDANTGIDFAHIHASAGTTGNLESNLIATGANYLNITLEDDTSDAGSQQLALSLFGGWNQGPGLTGLTALTTQLATAPGGTIGLSLQLFGLDFNGAGTAGEYTIAIGDQSGVGGKYKLTLNTSTNPLYASNVVQAVPVPAAIWLFGSALAGMGVIGRRRSTVLA